MSEPSTQAMSQWYAVQTLSNKEPAVKRYLERCLATEEMEDCIFEVLMPTQTITEIKSGKKTQKVRKFYPGYIFLNMRLFDENGKLLEKPWYYVQGADGVIGFLGGNNPTPLKEHEIERILSQMQEAEGKEVPKIQFEVGDEIKINDGPFLNLTGNIDEIDPEHGKLKVSVSIFGRLTPVVLEYWQVENVTE